MKKVTSCFLMLVFPMFIFARDVTERSVEHMNSWQEVFDLNGKKTGKYNIVVTVTDKGGNQAIAGPYNIFIDPESDYPVTTITNPVAEMHIPGNLNIVGTCVDDDAVDHVDLVFDGDREHPVRAEGKEFWSYYLDTTKMSEGLHTIEVFGTDVNGLQGKSVNVFWNLDRHVPETMVTNYTVGNLVSGIINLKGTITDGNGIKALFYSTDAGKHFYKIKIERNKKQGDWTFSVPIDTRKGSDGPSVVWFKAVDGQNSEGVYTFLYFVDNTKPDADIVWPEKNTVQNGIFSVAGYARDTIGISKLSWVFDDQSGDFDLIPGNPYWCKDFDTRNIKKKSVKFSIIAHDKAGNTTTIEREIHLDQDQDKPSVTISDPIPGTIVDGKGTSFFRGIASDDDGIDEVSWSFDGGNEQTIHTHGVFCTPLAPDTELSAGKHKIIVTAVDINGVESNPVSVEFTAKGPAGRFADAQIRNKKTSGDSSEAVFYGMQVNPLEKPVYETTASADCGIHSIQWKIESDSGILKEENRDLRTPSATVPVYIPIEEAAAGVVTIFVTATDIYGRTFEQKSVLCIQPYGAEGGTSATEVPPEAPVPVPGDTEKPVLKVLSPENQEWVRQELKISGTASDQGGIAIVQYSLDGGTDWINCSISQAADAAKSAVFSVSVPLTMDDGLVRIDVKAEDRSGNESRIHIAVQKDTTSPQVQVLLPVVQDTVNGETLIVFKVKDIGRLIKAEYIVPENHTADSKTGKEAQKKKSGSRQLELHPLITAMVGTQEEPISDAMSFDFTDEAGNVTSIQSWQFFIDASSDFPQAEINLPAENEIITRDFKLSGVLYDDDGPSKFFYKIDNGVFTGTAEYETSFSVDIPVSSLTDNEHTITAYAVDINGTKGNEVKRSFRVSLEEPEGSLISPDFKQTVREQVTLKGIASDKNGISKVMVSLDNGNTYNDAEGTGNWTYSFDSRLFQDGSHSVFIRIYDGYGIQGLYSSLINIDNTKPELFLELPLDGSRISGPLFFSGNVLDNIDLSEVYISIHALDKVNQAPDKLKKIKLSTDRIISRPVDLSELENGLYNLEVTALDTAGNATHVSRNVELDKTVPLAKVDILYPLNGQHLQGVFNLYGSVTAQKTVNTVTLFIDDTDAGTTELFETGYFKFTLAPETLTAGSHSYKIQAKLEDGTVIYSSAQMLTYMPDGPWVTIDNFTYGDFAVNRPYLNGRAGYTLSEDDIINAKAKTSTAEERAAITAKSVQKVELSFDNGRTFSEVSRNGKWRYRIENDDMADGYHFLLVRATMKNGETAVTRTIVQIDKVKPDLRLISPGEGGRYNQKIEFSGLASDQIGLKSVTLALRKGDKAAYEVPAFIQGLYFDWHFWGATLFDIGVGLTFFDDNVKVQFQWGQFTQNQRDMFTNTAMRYGGDSIFGIKILANVGNIPFRYFWGPDWDWLSSSFAVGANFTRFNQTNSGKAQILSALLGQIEFPRITFPQMKRFRTFSLYTEFQLWFIPSDISGTGTSSVQNLVPQISEGIRLNVF